MRGIILVASLSLACGGCAAEPPPPPIISQVMPTASPDNQACHNYTAQAVIDGLLQPIVGRACQQPDGTWTIVEGPPSNPGQFTTVYAPPPYPYYDYADAWLWSAPIGLSVGALVFVDRHHHFHDGHQFVHNGHFFHFERHRVFGHAAHGGRLG